jgi:hypothetical protein
MYREALADAGQILPNFGNLDYPVVVLNIFGEGVAEVDFLFV